MSKTSKIILWIIVAIIIIGGIWYGVSRKPAKEETIKIGFIAPLSGDAAAYGQTGLNSVNLALEEINKNRKQRIEIIAEDGKCNGTNAATAAQKLVNVDKVKVIIGGFCSSELLAEAPITESARVIVISPFASNPQISDAGEYIFRNCPTDFDWAPLAGETMYRDGYRKLALLSENTEFAVGAKNIIKDKFIEKGGNVVSDEIYEQSAKDYRTQITKIKNSNPDVIFLLPQSDVSGGLAAKQIREMGLTVPIYSTYIWTSEGAIDAAGEASEGIYFFDTPAISKDNKKATEFLNNYKAKYGAPAHDLLAALSYDIPHIINNALQKCDLDTACIKNYLYSLKNYEGAAGIYGFNEKGDVVGINFVKKQIIKGQATTVSE